MSAKKTAKQGHVKLSTAGLRDVAFVLYSLFRVGSLSATEILKEAGDLLPQHRELLHQGSRSILMRGTTFSEAVAGLFPPTILTVIKAGDEAGSLDKVFHQIWQTSKTQVEIEKLLGKLRMPAAIAGFGLVIILGFMCFLIPSIYSSFANTVPPDYQPSAVISWSLAANEIVTTNPLAVAFGTIVLLVSAFALFTSDSFKGWMGNQLVKAAIRFPQLGRAYANLRFGIVAKYIAIVSAAGLDSNRRIDLVLEVLPGPMRRGLVAFRSEMFTKGIAAAASNEGRAPTDPRTSEVL
jgi:type II secretory pathway component PulF